MICNNLPSLILLKQMHIDPPSAHILQNFIPLYLHHFCQLLKFKMSFRAMGKIYKQLLKQTFQLKKSRISALKFALPKLCNVPCNAPPPCVVHTSF